MGFELETSGVGNNCSANCATYLSIYLIFSTLNPLLLSLSLSHTHTHTHPHTHPHTHTFTFALYCQLSLNDLYPSVIFVMRIVVNLVPLSSKPYSRQLITNQFNCAQGLFTQAFSNGSQGRLFKKCFQATVSNMMRYFGQI